MRFRLTALFVSAALLNSLAQEGLGGSHTAIVGSHDGACDIDGGNHFAGASCTFPASVTGRGQTAFGAASAGFGSVGAFATAHAPGVPLTHSMFEVEAEAKSVFDDIIISGSAIVDNFLSTHVWFDVFGSLTAEAVTGALGSASAIVFITVQDGSESGLIIRNSNGLSENDGLFNIQPVDDGRYIVPVFGKFPVNAPSRVSISLDVEVFVDQNGAGPGGASATSSFAHTVSFARDRPVFDLPEGYTVNSVSANIVNNFWMGPPVPEPSSALLGLFAAAGWSAFAIRRKRG